MGFSLYLHSILRTHVLLLLLPIKSDTQHALCAISIEKSCGAFRNKFKHTLHFFSFLCVIIHVTFMEMNNIVYEWKEVYYLNSFIKAQQQQDCSCQPSVESIHGNIIFAISILMFLLQIP